ncbi:cytochrome c oxidase cbb3-type subunit 3 [Parapedobacter composti]|uniref:Cytochrome c oxidase cbb3-type subunit 3 n=1 Tax=Parapedobacter composti TaxID=623281 RepID=A0A1I1EC67_9SPHI|nr:cbb3-type cytochrome c oxidase N-terminal domain-containing protein [Parapedobacter composti]SFB84162.1 cytochrome c oxidase cbb3-type subunit 3 [Parapedobacter composti]
MKSLFLQLSVDDTLIIVLMLVMAVVLAAAAVVLRAVRMMIRLTMPHVLDVEQTARMQAKSRRALAIRAWWNKLMGLRPIAEEKDLVIDHAYDGITELDNPVPAWFNGLFYASVVFAAVYLCIYHVFGWGPNQQEEYAREMAKAEKARQEWLAQAANNVDENSVGVDLRPEIIAAGQAVFSQNCSACHGVAGEGGIGPNLTDRYWLHGGEISDIFKVVKYGVLDKGMVPWEQSLTPAQIAEVSNYIVSLRDTHPPNAKAPQGEEVQYEAAEATIQQL